MSPLSGGDAINTEPTTMTDLAVFHGPMALLILCGLVFIEEVGVPLIFAPGDLLLVLAGVLVAGGSVSPFVAFPALALASGGGALTGYQWTRLLGRHRLRALAVRLHIAAAMDDVERRLSDATPVAVFILRILPGLRIYTSLAGGALGLPRRVFVLGMIPSVIVWVGVFTGLGCVASSTIEGILASVDRLLAPAGVGLAAVTLCVTVVRRARRQNRPAGATGAAGAA